MTEAFDQASWDRRWADVLRDHPDKVAGRPPNATLVAEFSTSTPGVALDAGSGHGAEATWLAANGWQVTAVDFSAYALEHARATAEKLDLAHRIDWVEGDLGVWAPDPESFNLVSCLYVHVAGEVEEFVARLASGVAPGGSLFMVGHQNTPGQVQVSVEAAKRALDEEQWDVRIAEERPRDAAAPGVDAVVLAVRRLRPSPAR